LGVSQLLHRDQCVDLTHFRNALRELGFVEGRNIIIIITARYAPTAIATDRQRLLQILFGFL
jgi:Fe2+ transport system protein FeoA